MECYIGTKIVLAEPMDDVTFNFQVRSLPHIVEVGADGKGKPGYYVRYEDGYASWSPKEVFERCYRRITDAEKSLLTV